MEVQVKNQLENYKMRRIVLAVLLCSLVILIRSAISQQSSTKSIKKVNDVKSENFRLAKYNSLLWSPSDITVTFKKSLSNQTELAQGRANEEAKPIHNQQLSINSNSATKKSRSIESYERKHSKHSGN